MADKKPEQPYGSDPSTKPVLDALNAILEEFRNQARLASASISTIPPLTEQAETSVNAFREISDALNVGPGNGFVVGARREA